MTVWDVSSVAYNDTKNKQRQMEEPLQKVGHVAEHCALWFEATLMYEGTNLQLSEVCQHEFSSFSLACEGRFTALSKLLLIS